jgi:hypothetical protein
MKSLLSILLLSPIILSVIFLDIIKLPVVLFIIAPLTFLFALSDLLRGVPNWLDNWIHFNLQIGCLTYMMKDILFGT